MLIKIKLVSYSSFLKNPFAQTSKKEEVIRRQNVKRREGRERDVPGSGGRRSPMEMEVRQVVGRRGRESVTPGAWNRGDRREAPIPASPRGMVL